MRKALFALVALFTPALACASDPGPAAQSPAALVSPSPASDDFLRLTAYDFERLAGGNPASPQVARVGDAFDLSIGSITLPPAVTAQSLSLLLPPGSASLEDQGLEIEKVTAAGQGLTATVVPIRAGSLTLPSLAIVALPEKKAIARTNPFSITVASAISGSDPKPQEAAPLQPPAMIAFPTWVIVSVSFIGALLLGGLFFALYRWSKSRSKQLPPAPAAPPLSEDEAALAALLQAEKSDLLLKGEFKKHSFRVSEILKSYIGGRYGFDAPECTTSEILSRLGSMTEGFASTFDSGQLANLKALFESLDRVKFADHIPTSEEAAQFVPTARRFVLATRKRKVIT
ncbi:MAG: hypothetical protein P4M08_11765 [Oligoflexia bacterium]|nr:hypothetical protein [Oligoflexia bacterium]